MWKSSTLGGLLWGTGIAVTVINFDRSLAVKVAVEDVTVAVFAPPRAQLSIPDAIEPIDEPRELESHEGVKVLITQMALEGVLLGHIPDRAFFDDFLVQPRSSDAVQVQHNDA